MQKRSPVENSPLHITNVYYLSNILQAWECLGDMNFSRTFSSIAADDLNEFNLTGFSFSSLPSGEVRTQLRAATPSPSYPSTLSTWAQPSSSITLKPSLSPQTVSHHMRSQKQLCIFKWIKAFLWERSVLGELEAHVLCCAELSLSFMSESLQPHGLQPTRLLSPWGFSRQEH